MNQANEECDIKNSAIKTGIKMNPELEGYRTNIVK